MTDVQHEANLMAARERAIAQLHRHPGMVALREAFEDSKAETIQMIGERIVRTAKADQDKIAQTAGYLRGASWWLNNRVENAVSTAKAAEEEA